MYLVLDLVLAVQLSLVGTVDVTLQNVSVSIYGYRATNDLAASTACVSQAHNSAAALIY